MPSDIGTGQTSMEVLHESGVLGQLTVQYKGCNCRLLVRHQ
jgi:hypothetical protein